MRYLLSVVFCLEVALCCSPSAAFAQTVQLILTQPPPGRFGVQDLWSLQLVNASTVPVSVVLRGEVNESNNGEIYVVESAALSVKPGTSRLSYADIPSPRVLKSVPKYQEALQRSGSVPSGNYSYCVKALALSNRAELATSCITQTVVAISPPLLLSPEDNSVLNTQHNLQFNWLPPSPVSGTMPRYKLRIVPIYGTQSKEVAAETNNPWFSAENISQTSYMLPLSARPLQVGQRYVWMVSTTVGAELLRSEVAEFSIATKQDGNTTAGNSTTLQGAATDASKIESGNTTVAHSESLSTTNNPQQIPCACGDTSRFLASISFTRDGQPKDRLNEPAVGGENFRFTSQVKPVLCSPDTCKARISRGWEIIWKSLDDDKVHSLSQEGDAIDFKVPTNAKEFSAHFYYTMRCGSNTCIVIERTSSFSVRYPCCKLIRAKNNGRLLWRDNKGNTIELRGNAAIITINNKVFTVEYSGLNLEEIFCTLTPNQIVSALQDKKSSILKDGKLQEHARTTSALITAPSPDVPELSPTYLVQFSGQISNGASTESFNVHCSINRDNCEYMLFFHSSHNDESYLREYCSSPFIGLPSLGKAIAAEGNDYTNPDEWDKKMRNAVSGLVQWEGWLQEHPNEAAQSEYYRLRKIWLDKLCRFISNVAATDNIVRRMVGKEELDKAKEFICKAVNDSSISMESIARTYILLWTASRALPPKR